MLTSLRRFRVLLAVVAVLALVAAAGGDDDGDDGTEDTGGDGDATAAVPTCLTIPDLYALTGPESEGFDDWQDADELATTVGGDDAFPDLPLTIVAPGEESGTYDTFVELVMEDIAEEQGVAEDDIAARRDYQSSPNDNVIVEGISDTEGSLGWVGYAFYVNNTDVLRAIEVADEGGGCVEPTDETIASGDYPLSRPLFIYVNTDKAAENNTLACFVDFYLGDEGYASVADVGYVQLDESAWGETQAAWEETGIECDDSGDLSGSIEVSGSSTVEPITADVAEKFTGENSGAAIAVEGPGTGDGFQRFCAGETDISDASRPIADPEEIDTCADAGVEWVELRVGIDGIAVITSA